MRVSDYECVPVTDQSAHHITTIKFFTSSAQQSLQIEIVKYKLIDLLVGVTIRFVPVKESLHFIVEEVTDFF